MSKRDLIGFCRFYHGEDMPPARLSCEHLNLWNYERVWVRDTANGDEYGGLGRMLSEYIRAGLRTFSETDDVPVTLKAVLFNRFLQHSEGMAPLDEFKKWYLDYYLSHPKD